MDPWLTELLCAPMLCAKSPVVESSPAACRKDAFAIEAEAALKRVKAKVQLDRGSRKQSLMRGRIALAQQRQFQQVHPAHNMLHPRPRTTTP